VGKTPTRTGHRSSHPDPRSKETSLSILLSSESALERKLATGELSCPDCGAFVVPWGFARRRVIRTLAGARTLSPRRVRCRSCNKTHVVLPGEVVPRRRDDAGVIGRALLRAACGARAGEIACELNRSRETVRNWISRFSDNALVAELIGTRTLLAFDAHADPMRLTWRQGPLARAVEALGLSVAAVVRLTGPLPPTTTPWSLVNVLTRGHLLRADLGP
jgi:transposase-like protein